MDKHKSLNRRIKQHIIGKRQEFFIVTAPGFEKLCLDELNTLPFSVAQTKTVFGGVEFEARIHDCYLANLSLRTANRILMRIAGFRASNFRQLEKRLSQIPWELYLHNNSALDINITSRHSRLYHKAAIEERIASVIRANKNLAALQSDSNGNVSCPHKLFVRVIDDHFVISIDSSGEPLYKRGIKRQRAKAPMRETMAAALLKIAGYNPELPLIDPMCGAGTFSLEAAMISKNIPPGMYRNFAFMDWPSFRPDRWKYIRQKAEKSILPEDRPLILASDKDDKACIRLDKIIHDFSLSGMIKVMHEDFFDLTPGRIEDIFKTNNKGLFIINPPYGIRLEAKERSSRLIIKIIAKLRKYYRGWGLALFSVDRSIIRKIPFKVRTMTLDHGGLKLTFLTCKIK